MPTNKPPPPPLLLFQKGGSRDRQCNCFLSYLQRPTIKKHMYLCKTEIVTEVCRSTDSTNNAPKWE